MCWVYFIQFMLIHQRNHLFRIFIEYNSKIETTTVNWVAALVDIYTCDKNGHPSFRFSDARFHTWFCYLSIVDYCAYSRVSLSFSLFLSLSLENFDPCQCLSICFPVHPSVYSVHWFESVCAECSHRPVCIAKNWLIDQDSPHWWKAIRGKCSMLLSTLFESSVH